MFQNLPQTVKGMHEKKLEIGFRVQGLVFLIDPDQDSEEFGIMVHYLQNPTPLQPYYFQSSSFAFCFSLRSSLEV